MIPKIIHQIWIGNKPKPVKLMQTWKDKHPDYQFIEWNNETIKKMKFACQDRIDELWHLERWSGIADIIRYEVLYEFGGFVAPADSVCLNRIDDLLGYENGFCCYENEELRKGLLSPHLGMPQKSNLMAVLVAIIKRDTQILRADAWITTGNKLLTDVVESMKFPIEILPSYTFIPEHYTGDTYAGEGKIYAKHFWGSTKGLLDKLDEQI